MKKNGEFVGVDEKYIPEGEKYIDESILGDKKKTQKRIKFVYIIFLCLVIAIPIFVFVASICQVNGMFKGDFNSNLEYEVKIFNSGFDLYVGTEYGNSIYDLLDKVIQKNKTNSNHVITVVYNNNTTTNEMDIINIKYSLDEWTKYEVLLDYDTNGFINKVTIKDI